MKQSNLQSIPLMPRRRSLISKSQCKKLHTKRNKSEIRRCGPLTMLSRLQTVHKGATTRAIAGRVQTLKCSSSTMDRTRVVKGRKLTQANRLTTRHSRTRVPPHRDTITATTVWMDTKKARPPPHLTTTLSKTRLPAMISLSTIEES